jgi:hypothetical protein
MELTQLSSRRVRRLLGVCLFTAPMLLACAKTTVPVSLHGVNYSAEPFSYLVVDPNDEKNTGGGELIESYAAGGTMCCFELPKTWRAGIKVEIRSTHWLPKAADGHLPVVKEKHVVDVPRYGDGKAGELWVLRAADGSMSLVSSDFQPDHPKWPGTVKGWPVPSLAYQRERWDIYINHEKGGVKLFEGLLVDLKASPDSTAKEHWDYDLRYDKKSLEGFSGSNDVKYREKLRQEFEEGLSHSRRELERLQKGRP